MSYLNAFICVLTAIRASRGNYALTAVKIDSEGFWALYFDVLTVSVMTKNALDAFKCFRKEIFQIV